MATKERTAGEIDDEVVTVALAQRQRELEEGPDSLVVEGEVIAVCLAALARIHPTRRGNVADYLRERCKGFDYLALCAQLSTDLSSRWREADAEASRLRVENERFRRGLPAPKPSPAPRVETSAAKLAAEVDARLDGSPSLKEGSEQ